MRVTSRKNPGAEYGKIYPGAFLEGLTLATLAGEFKMSESYISSPHKEENRKRLWGTSDGGKGSEGPGEYLRTTNDSIEAIAERVGYPDYFILPKVCHKRHEDQPGSLQALKGRNPSAAWGCRCISSQGALWEFPVQSQNGVFLTVSGWPEFCQRGPKLLRRQREVVANGRWERPLPHDSSDRPLGRQNS